MTTMMRRPQLQDLVKEAMEGSVRKVDINFEAARQLANLGETERTKTAAPELNITSGEYIDKLAGALDYLAKQAAEDSSNVGPGVGPGALPASAATSSGQVLEAGRSGQGIKQPPKNPPMQSSGVANDAATGLQDNMEQSHADYPVDPMHNEKTSSVLFQRNIARLTKLARKEGGTPRSGILPDWAYGAVPGFLGGAGVGAIPGGVMSHQGGQMAEQLGEDPTLGAKRSALGQMVGGLGGSLVGGTVGSMAKVPGMGLLGGMGGAYLGHRVATQDMAERLQMAKELEAAKMGSSILERNLLRLGLLKHAEDGDGEGGAPHISAGAAPAQGAVAPPGAAPSGEQVPGEPSDVNAQKALIGSNEAAINYTKRQAKADPKRDSNHVWDEPALSSAHDSVLQQAFDATPKAGVKISQDLTRVAAAQALLRKYAEEAKEKKEEAKEKKSKEKESSMGPTPAQASGFSAGSNTGM